MREGSETREEEREREGKEEGWKGGGCSADVRVYRLCPTVERDRRDDGLS